MSGGGSREHLRRVNPRRLTPQELSARLHAEYPGTPSRHPGSRAQLGSRTKLDMSVMLESLTDRPLNLS
jgi:hypothetical protein